MQVGEFLWKYINPSNFNKPPFNLTKRDLLQYRIKFMLLATLLFLLDDSKICDSVDPSWLLVLINNKFSN